jgi:hypothetical protein
MVQTQRLGSSRDEEQEAADRQTASLAGLAVTLLVVVVGLYVVHQLVIKAQVEDCLLANHANCDLIVARLR